MPALTRSLLLANLAAFALLYATGSELFEWFALWPLGSGLFLPWQLLSYAFLHGSLTHLAFNMFGLYMFGSELERVWGAKRLAAFYTVSVLVAALAQLVITAWLDQTTPTVGASGGLFGLLVGFAMMFPERRVMLLIPPIPLPAPLFVLLYGALELFFGVTGTVSGVAHFAHLGGLLGGWLTIRYWRGQAPFSGQAR